jgi:Uma2 family endonuclease
MNPPPLRYKRAPRPIHFPTDLEMPEGKVHFKMCTLLYQILERAYSGQASLGCDQFVYWNAREPRRCLAPDAFVRRGRPDDLFKSWKTWERGAPELAVEIVSDTDRADPWEEKLERYHEMGVRELVRFDADDPPGTRIRVWDRVEEDLVERELHGDTTPCATLSLHWVVAPGEGLPAALRLARDPEGRDLLPSPAEERDALGAELARLRDA